MRPQSRARQLKVVHFPLISLPSSAFKYLIAVDVFLQIANNVILLYRNLLHIEKVEIPVQGALLSIDAQALPIYTDIAFRKRFHEVLLHIVSSAAGRTKEVGGWLSDGLGQEADGRTKCPPRPRCGVAGRKVRCATAK